MSRQSEQEKKIIEYADLLLTVTMQRDAAVAGCWNAYESLWMLCPGAWDTMDDLDTAISKATGMAEKDVSVEVLRRMKGIRRPYSLKGFAKRRRTMHQRDALLEAAEDHARQLSRLSGKLASPNQPAHVDYISKRDAAVWCDRLAQGLRAAIANAEKGGG